MKRIFIVDDHPIIRQSYTSFLNEEPGLTVCGAVATFDEALRAIPEVRPDLVLVDISLGKNSPDGIELISRLRGAMDGTRWLVISANDGPQVIRRAFGNGAQGFLAKHRAADGLHEAVRVVLNGAQYGGVQAE